MTAALGSASVVAFVPSRDLGRAREFYVGVLGLTFVSIDPFALVLSANGVTVRVADVSGVSGFAPAPYTVLGWHVASVEQIVRDLFARGIAFERFAGMQHDALGIWRSPSGARVAWFRDPEGNLLSVTEG